MLANPQGPVDPRPYPPKRIATSARLWLGAMGILLSLPIEVRAQTNLIANGGFETGNLNGWIVATPGIGATYDDDGTNVGTAQANFFASSSTTAPISGLPTLGPKTGSYYALSDMNAKSNVALLQSFVASSSVVNISFDMYVYDWSGSTAYDSMAGLNYNTSNGNQAARVDLLFGSAVSGGGAAYYTTAPSAIDATLYGPGADAASQGNNPTAPTFTHYSQNVNVTAGQTYYLRFGAVDNQFQINQVIDNVSVTSAAVPEPSSAALLLSVLLGTVWVPACVEVATHLRPRHRKGSSLGHFKHAKEIVSYVYLYLF